MADKKKKRHPLRSVKPSPLKTKPVKTVKPREEKKAAPERIALKAPTLTPAERQKLKAQAHSLSPIVIVGTDGITDGVISAVNEALFSHELIKVRMHEPEEKHEMAQILADESLSQLIALRGHTVILWRPNREISY
ncbi:YhbY family RNA-binding protein [Myxococcota bacterium]|nr:YhbY family RNA-binding protein [Myxococcota bacterium]MBU1379205.1 YhbY family RNA-binding protein [Myxococcota bacterium]MBU1496224.1 YhbY family RNA-binding protein [Myxococcota bacterium]